ncbi:MAG: SCO family protein [Pseudomonadota bacterium]
MRCSAIFLLMSALGFAQGTFAASATGQEAEVFLAPGWGKLSFEAPAPATYELPAIRKATGGKVLDASGESLDLDSLLGDKIAILSFIYRTCDDVNGCPLSTMVSYKVAEKLQEKPEFADQLRLLTLSFDPANDTPEAMLEYGEGIKEDSETDWRFLTTASEADLQPILDAYQQSVVPDGMSADGKQRKFSHILRVYLIDRQKQIRNIYSVSFLHPDILINDVLTLLAEESALADRR